VSSLWLSQTPKNRTYLRVDPRPSHDSPLRIRFDVVRDAGFPEEPPLGEKGAVCPRCATPVPFADLRDQGRRGLLGFQLNAYVTRVGTNMEFFPASVAHEAAALAARPRWMPDTALPDAALGFRVQKYGLTHHKDLFLPRQLAALSIFADAVDDVVKEVRVDAKADHRYADALSLYLGIFFDRLVQTNNALVRWFTHRDRPSKAQPTFDKQTVQMIWDFAEANPLADATGGWDTCCKYPQTALDCLPRTPGHGSVVHADSAAFELPHGDIVFSTDPPYFDNIGYADLSDFFYIWLRRVLKDVYPKVFQTVLVPKAEEIISDPSRHGGSRAEAKEFFYERISGVFRRMRESASPLFPATIFYAFKQEETTSDGGVVSTGWERMLQALLDADWRITATWPIRTEHANRPRSIGANALASSIVLACRPRERGAPIASRRDFLNELRREMPAGLAQLQRSNIAPVDLAQAAIGPGMAVFSKYSNVVDASGRSLTVREALALVNAVLDEVVAEQEGDFDADTRWAITWFEQTGFGEGDFDSAETLSKAKVTSVNGMVDAGIIATHRGKVRLLRPSELRDDWDPDRDHRLTAWEVTHQLIRALESGGEHGGAELLRRLGDRSRVGRELAYRLFALCERKGRAAEAMPYNGLIQSWGEISRLAGNTAVVQGGLFDDVGA
jgi:putative DNA methylase